MGFGLGLWSERQRDREAKGQKCKVAKVAVRQRGREAERQRGKEAEGHKRKVAVSQRGREAKRDKERRKAKETKRQRDIVAKRLKGQ